LPTVLPQARRVAKKRTLTRTVCEFLFNAAMVVSALILTFMVLVREERYPSEAQVQAIEQMTPQNAMDGTGDAGVIPPSD
jgi:hypothetical protein